MRQFAGIVMAGDQVPDETTILNFRRLLERHDLTRVLFEGVKNYLDEHGFYLKQGTIVDASMIAAPSSTKNRDKKRDADMSSTKKNNQWYYGMKAHIGVDTDSRLVHSGEATTAKVQDSQKLDGLLHGEERDVHGDKAYAGAERQLLNSNPDERIWGMPFKKPKGGELKDWEKGINRRLSGLARQGRTSLSRHQVPARVPQGALQRLGKERQTPTDAICLGQSIHGSKAIIGECRISLPRRREICPIGRDNEEHRLKTEQSDKVLFIYQLLQIISKVVEQSFSSS